jgi:hypothetical protein
VSIPESMCDIILGIDVLSKTGMGDKIGVGIEMGKNCNHRRNWELDKFYRDKKTIYGDLIFVCLIEIEKGEVKKIKD